MAYSKFSSAGLILLAIGLFANPAIADGDVKKGERVFNKCKICHDINQEKNKIGPHLVGIMGRKAGSVSGYKYSPAMKKADIVWSPENMTKYLTKPKALVPGTKMAFAGIKNEQQIVDLIAYLNAAAKKPD